MIDIRENVSLKEYSTFKIGGFSKYFTIVKSTKDIEEAVSWAEEKKIDFMIIGEGSNILFRDDIWNGLIIKNEIKGYEIIDKDKCIIKVGGGENWDEFVERTINDGFYGLENLSYIPGTVGASPVQNIGAYGVEIKDFIHEVLVYNRDRKIFMTFLNSECLFEYRNSIFKKEKKYIISEVIFKLHKDISKINTSYKDLENYRGKKDSPQDIRNAVIEIRRNKLPDWKTVGTAGSFFKNPIINREDLDRLRKEYPDIVFYDKPEGKNGMVKLSLAWIIDNICKKKGFSKDGVSIYKNQALVIIADREVKSEDVLNFAHEIEKDVFDKTSIKIEKEVIIL